MSSSHLSMTSSTTTQKRQWEHMTMADQLLSPPRSPGRSRTPSPTLVRTLPKEVRRRLPSLDISQAYVAALSDPAPLKSAIKRAELRSHAKSVTWDSNVVDNDHKRRLLPVARPLKPRVRSSKYQMTEVVQTKERYHVSTFNNLLRPPTLAGTSFETGPLLEEAAEHMIQSNRIVLTQETQQKMLQDPGLSAGVDITVQKARPRLHRRLPILTGNVLPRVPEPPREVAAGRHSKTTSEVFQEESFPDKVDNLAQHLMIEMPPTPRPQRLPTPELTETWHNPFCVCCVKGPSPIISEKRPRLQDDRSKWELQYENAMNYIEATRRK